MTKGDLFVMGVVLWEGLAGLSYLWEGEWSQAGIWLCVSLSNVCYLLTIRR